MAKLISEAQAINGRMDKIFGQNPSLWPWDLWRAMSRVWLAARFGDVDRFRDAVDGLVDSLSPTDAAAVFGS
ncbi:MAG: hypothetical protein ACYCZN_01850 [Candidatus Dormibacteria bacterium]